MALRVDLITQNQFCAFNNQNRVPLHQQTSHGLITPCYTVKLYGFLRRPCLNKFHIWKSFYFCLHQTSDRTRALTLRSPGGCENGNKSCLNEKKKKRQRCEAALSASICRLLLLLLLQSTTGRCDVRLNAGSFLFTVTANKVRRWEAAAYMQTVYVCKFCQVTFK